MSASPEASRARLRLRAPVTSPGDRWRLGLVVVFVLAFVVRLTPLIRTGSLTGPLGPDDGRYYSASAHLLHGLAPYRDVAFGQTPGISVLLLPFAALATVVGDPVGLATARIAVVLVGAVNAVLVALVLRRFAPSWALVGGLLHATWRLPAAAERAVALEPLLTLGLLGALVLLGSAGGGRAQPGDALRPRRTAAAGALLGLATAVTLWAAPAAVLVTGYVLFTRTTRAVALWAGGAVAGFTALAGPVIAVAPVAFFRQAVHDQALAAAEATRSDRLRRFSDLVRLGEYDLPDSIDVMVATCAVVALATAALTAWWEPRARLPVLLLALQCAMVATAPDYGYERFAGCPTLVIVMIAAVHGLLPDPWAGAARHPAAAVTGLLLVGLVLTGVHNVVPRPPDPTPAREFAAAHRCVWFDTASQAIAADALTTQLSHNCPVPVDRLADLRALDVPITGNPRQAARRSPSFQLHLQADLLSTDAAVIGDDEDDSVLGEASREWLEKEFEATGEDDDATFWVHRR